MIPQAGAIFAILGVNPAYKALTPSVRMIARMSGTVDVGSDEGDE